MARITIEDCLEREPNRFTLVLMAAKRAKQLLSGKTALTDIGDNKSVVSALREIADGKVSKDPVVSKGESAQVFDEQSEQEEEVSSSHRDSSQESAVAI